MVGNVDVCFYGSTSANTVVDEPSTGSVDEQEYSGSEAVAERPRRLSDTSVLTLDGYGTLVDRESGIVSALMPWLQDRGVTASRSEVVRAFAQAEQVSLKPGIRYHDVLVRVHDRLSDFFDVPADRKAAKDFAASIGRWPVHPDAPAALAYLKQHFQLVVLTNADHASFDISSQALGVEFDAVYTAEDTGLYKPNSGMFAYLLNKLGEAGIDKQRILHVAGSIRFDHVPAKRLDMNTCWIHRKNGEQRLVKARKNGIDIHPDFRFRTLGGLVDAHWTEVRNA